MNAGNQFKGFCLKPLVFAVACCFAFGAHANPIGAQIVNGSAVINQTGNTLTISNSPSTIINWQDFSINSGEVTNFIQQSASSSVLNRVLGADPSRLLGTLTSNGKVFLVNPAGILVGQDARIDVGGLVASTLNLSDSDFVAGKLDFGATAGGVGTIRNYGSIATPEGGTVYLVASQIENQGLITTPKGEAILAAGNTVQLMDTGTPGVTVQVTGSSNSATNLGQILADSGRIGMVAATLKNSGTINASSIVNEGGRIFLRASQDTYVAGNSRIEASGTLGGSIDVLGQRVAVMDSASLDASGQNGGGSIRVGGDYQGQNPGVQNADITYLGANASIQADALNNGDGGRVIVWADDTTRAYGSISARGGDHGGAGGFVETSGHKHLDVSRAPDLAAPQGRGGEWLLDPESVTILPAGSSNIALATPFMPSGPGPSILSDAVLRAALVVGGAVTVDTTGGSGATGDIVVDATANLVGISAGAGAILNLKAHDDITVNSTITAIGAPMAMNLTADQDGSNTGAIFINAPLDSNNGSINLTSFGNIQLNSDGSPLVNINAGSGTATLTSLGGDIIGDPWGAPLDVQATSVSLIAVNGISAGAAAPFYVDAGSVSFNNSGTAGVRIFNEHAGASSFAGSAGGSLTLENFGTANPATVNSVSAGGDIIFRMDNINITGPVNAPAANMVYLAPYAFNSPVSIEGGATFDLTGGEISSITAGKMLVGYDNFGNYASLASIGTTAAVNITNAAKLGVAAPVISIGANNVSNTGGSLAFQTDSLSFGGGAIDVGTGMVFINGKAKSQIDLGGTDTTPILGLTATGLASITAGKLLVGDTSTTNMLVSGSIFLPNVSTLILNSGAGGVSGSGSLAVSNLAVRAVGSVDLSGGANSVTNVAASVGNFLTPAIITPDFKFNNGISALNVGAGIDGLSGISMAISGTFNPAIPDGMIALQTSGALTQSAGALLGGKAVYAGGSKVNLTEANPTGVLAGAASGLSPGDSFSYNSSNGIWVTSVNSVAGVSATGAVNLQAVGATSDLVLDTQVTSGATSGDAVVLAAGRNFINNAGITINPGARWLIYSKGPANDIFGGLNSGNRAIWNTTFSGTPPTSVVQSGNRYLFSFQPTLTFTSTNLSKTYGANATAAVANAYSVSGLNAGVGGAYLADSNASVFSGAPSVTSSGATSLASAAGSPYAINVSSGSLGSLNGYAFAYQSSGLLTINPLAVTLTLAGNKIYDGSPDFSTGQLAISNLMPGDVASLSAGTASTADSNAGNGKPFVAFSGLTLTGASASNYSLAGVSGTGDIAPRPVTLTVDPGQGKIYGQLDPVYLSFNDTAGAMQVVDGELLNGGLSRAQGENAGLYAITQGGLTSANNPNYSISFIGDDFTIAPAPLSIVANPQIKVVGSDDPAQSFVLNGLMQNPALGIDDVAAATSGSLMSGAMTREAGETVGGGSSNGGYAYAQGTLSAGGNYNISSFTSNTLSIISPTVPPEVQQPTPLPTAPPAEQPGVPVLDTALPGGGSGAAFDSGADSNAAGGAFGTFGGNDSNALNGQPSDEDAEKNNTGNEGGDGDNTNDNQGTPNEKPGSC